MLHSRKLNSKINHLQEWSLRIVYHDYITSFEDLLKRDSSFKIHHKNIQSLATELFKVKKGIANPILCDIFPLRSIDYNLRSQVDFSVGSVNTTHFGLHSLRCFASKVWNMVPLELKNLSDIEIHKSRINGKQYNANVYYLRHICTVQVMWISVTINFTITSINFYIFMYL